MFEDTLKLIRSGVGTAFPCAAVAVGVGHDVFVRKFLGQRQIQPDVLNITEDTHFDIASLSKLVATSMVALKFIENGKLSLNDNISKFLNYTGNFSECEIRHLLTHTSGMQPWIPLFGMLQKNGDAFALLWIRRDVITRTKKSVTHAWDISFFNVYLKISGMNLLTNLLKNMFLSLSA